MKMNNKKQTGHVSGKRLLSLTLALLALALLQVSAFAAQSVETEIPFKVVGAEGTVTLEAVDGAPLPETTKITTSTGGSFRVQHSEPGDYTYKVRQIPGDRKDVTYDNQEYEVLIAVNIDESGKLSSGPLSRGTSRRPGTRPERRCTSWPACCRPRPWS